MRNWSATGSCSSSKRSVLQYVARDLQEYRPTSCKIVHDLLTFSSETKVVPLHSARTNPTAITVARFIVSSLVFPELPELTPSSRKVAPSTNSRLPHSEWLRGCWRSKCVERCALREKAKRVRRRTPFAHENTQKIQLRRVLGGLASLLRGKWLSRRVRSG